MAIVEMRKYALLKYGVTLIDGQVNSYCSKTGLHRRSYACVCMKRALFDKIQPYFQRFGVKYITQTNSVWNLSGIDGPVWVTKQNDLGVTRIELLEDTIQIEDDDIYVVMWNARFLSKFVRRGWLFDMDTILIDLLAGSKKPVWFVIRWLICFFSK